MGTSTNAILFYGYCWDEETELIEGGGEWVNVIAKQRGVTNPWDKYVEPDQKLSYHERERITKAWRDANRAELDAMYAAKRAIEKEYNCEIGYHCSGEYSMPYVAIAACGITAYRGYPKPISAADLKVDAAWDEEIARFCRDVGITPPKDQKPQWWLVSYWSC
jgi:hypothetical protein